MLPYMIRRALLPIAAVAVLAACNEDEITNPDNTTPTQTITTDSAGTWVFLRLDDEAQKVTVPTPTASTGWHMGFNGTSVMLNGGAAGPGGVSGYCICQNATATNEQIAAMTPATELADFEAVTAEDIPAAEEFITDDLNPAIFGWYNGTPGTSATVNAGQTFLISQGSGGSRLLGKFHVLSIASPTATSPGTVTIEWGMQSTPGGAFTIDTAVLATDTGVVHVDLNANAAASASDWDLKIDGWMIQLNSGASGTGTWKALSAEGTPFATITKEFAAGPPEQTFKTDVFSGVFASNRWYKYNITGTDNQIWPTYNVYLLSIGAEVYKVQLISYYNTGGSSRFITVRYARIQ